MSGALPLSSFVDMRAFHPDPGGSLLRLHV